METRKLSDYYKPGRITWTADESTPVEFRDRVLQGGELIRLDRANGLELAVRFAAIPINGKSTHPIVRMGDRPALRAVVEAQRERDRLQAEAEARLKAERDAALAAIPDGQFFEVDAAVGETFNWRGKLWTVVGYARRRVWDNYEDEWVWKEVAGCVPATPEQRQAFEARVADVARVKAARAELVAIAGKIRADGEKPGPESQPEGETVDADGRDRIYGGGSWFVLGADWTWFVRNNGGDGDDWSWNNVRTGGAGAIGWRVPADAGLADRIRELAEAARFGT